MHNIAFILMTFISFQCFSQNQKSQFIVYVSAGPRLTQLKGYESYLGNKVVKRIPSFGYRADLGFRLKYKKFTLGTALGFKKSKSNYITLSTPYNLAEFNENFIRIDLLLYKFISTLETGYQINKKNYFNFGLSNSWDTYLKIPLVYNASLEIPDPSNSVHNLVSNEFLLNNRAETMIEFTWTYQWSSKWQYSLRASTSLIPYQLIYVTFPSPNHFVKNLLNIKENAFELNIIYNLYNSHKNVKKK